VMGKGADSATLGCATDCSFLYPSGDVVKQGGAMAATGTSKHTTGWGQGQRWAGCFFVRPGETSGGRGTEGPPPIAPHRGGDLPPSTGSAGSNLRPITPRHETATHQRKWNGGNVFFSMDRETEGPLLRHPSCVGQGDRTAVRGMAFGNSGCTRFSRCSVRQGGGLCAVSPLRRKRCPPAAAVGHRFFSRLFFFFFFFFFFGFFVSLLWFLLILFAAK